MLKKFNEKSDFEHFCNTFVDRDDPTVAVVMNRVAYEKAELHDFLRSLHTIAEKSNLGLNIQVHERSNDPDKYFVMIQMEKA